jgi:hypothetical protein
MNPLPRMWRCWPLVLLTLAAGARADEYSFDASRYEKKPFEINGYVQFKAEDLSFNGEGAFYKLGYYGEPQREDLGRTSETMELSGKLRQGIGTFDFHTYTNLQQDQLSHDSGNKLYEAAYSLRPRPGLTQEAGKRALSWGKGYAFNPIGFVQRAKDPNDPQLAREGYVLADGDFIFSPGGALQTVALTPVLIPVSKRMNSDLGATGHLNPAFKLYALYRDTDLDFAWQGRGSRPARYGMDFSRNLTSNFEIHGEWARILQFAKPVTDANGHANTEIENATSYLLGLRYLTQSNTTYLAEYYRNGTGYSETEADQFYQLVDTTFTQLQQTGSSPLLQSALRLGQGSYGRPFAGEDYLYFRAQQQDALGIVYLQPAVSAMLNLDDHSFQVTPELLYTGIKNVELRLRLYLLHGDSSTDFGEKASSRKLELYARYYF